MAFIAQISITKQSVEIVMNELSLPFERYLFPAEIIAANSTPPYNVAYWNAFFYNFMAGKNWKIGKNSQQSPNDCFFLIHRHS